MIDEFIKEFTDKRIDNIIRIRNDHFLASADLIGLNSKVSENINQDPILLGTFLGSEHRNRFHPSIALLDELHPLTDRKLVVDDKAEWLFLCGRDIFGTAVLGSSVKSSKGLVMVENRRNELLGYGKINAKLTEKNKVAVKNILDRGDFLRRER